MTFPHAIIEMLKSPEKKIITIEDQVEYTIEGIPQIQTNETIGLTYAKGIEQILRHDPDIIMVGEIRDEKAAKMAVVAANTGHLVLSTIHASKACTCISRMVELGVNINHLYENLLCISNQRMMINKANKEKTVLYEIMDKNEIDYYRKYNTNSKNFLSVEEQILKGVNDGIFEV